MPGTKHRTTDTNGYEWETRETPKWIGKTLRRVRERRERIAAAAAAAVGGGVGG